jgi:CRISPR-associated protein Cas1
MPFYAVREISVSSGNMVSTKALAWASIYGIKVLVTSQSGRPLGVYLPLNYDMHVETRLKQYQAYNSEKGIKIARTILASKIGFQKRVLEKYGLPPPDLVNGYSEEKILQVNDNSNFERVRTFLNMVEVRYAKHYFKQIFTLFPKFLKTETRNTHKAGEPLNNLFNLSYEVLKWEVYKSILEAHLDPYLGFLHSIQHAKPSLVCDLQEPYRPLIDSFLIEYCQRLGEKDLQLDYRDRRPRVFLKYPESSKLIADLNEFLDKRIRKQRTRGFGTHSKLRTVIREDAEQLARYIRGELSSWQPTTLPLNI